MRGTFVDQGGLFSYIAPEARVPVNHPLRKIRELVRDVLGELTRSLGRLYASEGRPSIPPEQLLSALLLQVFYGIRSERQLMEQLDYNLLYRWFVGLSPDDPIWDPTTFTKNRDRLQTGAVQIPGNETTRPGKFSWENCVYCAFERVSQVVMRSLNANRIRLATSSTSRWGLGQPRSQTNDGGSTDGYGCARAPAHSAEYHLLCGSWRGHR